VIEGSLEQAPRGIVCPAGTLQVAGFRPVRLRP